MELPTCLTIVGCWWCFFPMLNVRFVSFVSVLEFFYGWQILIWHLSFVLSSSFLSSVLSSLHFMFCDGVSDGWQIYIFLCCLCLFLLSVLSSFPFVICVGLFWWVADFNCWLQVALFVCFVVCFYVCWMSCNGKVRHFALGHFLVLCYVLCCVCCAHGLWFLRGGDVPLFVTCVLVDDCWRKIFILLLEDFYCDNGDWFVCLTSNSLTPPKKISIAACWNFWMGG